MRRLTLLAAVAALFMVALPVASAGAAPPEQVHFEVWSFFAEPPGAPAGFGTFNATGSAVGSGTVCNHGWTVDLSYKELQNKGPSSGATKLQILKQFGGAYDDPALASAPQQSVFQVLKFMNSLKSFRHLAIAAALHAFYGYGVQAFIAAFFIRSHQISTGEIGTWLAGIGFTVALFVNNVIRSACVTEIDRSADERLRESGFLDQRAVNDLAFGAAESDVAE